MPGRSVMCIGGNAPHPPPAGPARRKPPGRPTRIMPGSQRKRPGKTRREAWGGAGCSCNLQGDWGVTVSLGCGVGNGGQDTEMRGLLWVANTALGRAPLEKAWPAPPSPGFRSGRWEDRNWAPE